MIRLVAWNCAGGFARKVDAVRALRADIAVLSELPADCVSRLGDSASGLWIGREGGLGLAVVAFGASSLRRANVDAGEKLFLPVVWQNATTQLRLVGTCVQKDDGYVQPAMRAVERLTEFLTLGPAILAGDFNMTVALDAKRPPRQRSRPLFSRLEAIGLRSAWHEYEGETLGTETVPTHFWRWNESAHFHIDYTFVSAQIQVNEVKIERYFDYTRTGLSDHVPLIANLVV